MPSSVSPLAVWVQGTERNLLPGPTYSLGRDPGSDIVVDDSRVSWRHAVLKLDRDAWILEDGGSTNGTYPGHGGSGESRSIPTALSGSATRPTGPKCVASSPGRSRPLRRWARRTTPSRPAPGLDTVPIPVMPRIRAMPQSPAWPPTRVTAAQNRRDPPQPGNGRRGARRRGPLPRAGGPRRRRRPRAHDRRRHWTGCAGQAQATAAHLRAAATGHRAPNWPGARQRRGRRRP